MALIYDAQLSPSKPEVLSAWVPRQPWFAGDAGAGATIVGSYRFDDPDGEVGIETFLVRFGDGPVLQVPFTYRGEPLAGEPDPPEPVTTMEHSVLGRRWVYDGPDDPVYVGVLRRTVLTGGTEAKLVRSDGHELPSRGTARGSGVPGAGSDPGADPETVVRRVIDPADRSAPEPHLVGSWPGSDGPLLLAVLRLAD
jgi:hypothetical protein